MNSPFSQWETDSVSKNNSKDKYNIKSFISSGSYVKYIVLEDEENGQEYLGKLGTFTEGEIIHWPHLHHRSLAPFLNSMRINTNIIIYISSYSNQMLRDVLNMHDFVYHSDCFNKKKIYVEDVLWGLDYLHRKSLCLFNISDENIFIYNEEDKAVIVDFSCLARAEVSAKYKFKVPFLYRAPELNENAFTTDPISTEMWSVGVFILEVFLSHMVPWAMVNFESSRVGEILLNLNDVLQIANRGSVLDSSSIDEFKSFISAFFRRNPQNRCTARDAAVTEFIHSSKRPSHIAHSVSSNKCKASQISSYSKVYKKNAEEDILHQIDDNCLHRFQIANSVSSEKAQGSQKSFYAKVSKKISEENITYEIGNNCLHHFHIDDSVSSEICRCAKENEITSGENIPNDDKRLHYFDITNPVISGISRYAEVNETTSGVNISSEDDKRLHNFHITNSISSMKDQDSNISPTTKVCNKTISESILHDVGDDCLQRTFKLANFVNPIAFSMKERNLFNGTKRGCIKISPLITKSISTQTENIDFLEEIPIKDELDSPHFFINMDPFTNKETRNKIINKIKLNGLLQNERNLVEDSTNIFSGKIVESLPYLKPKFNISPNSLKSSAVKIIQYRCSNRSKSDSHILAKTDTPAPENFILSKKVREPIEQRMRKKILIQSQTQTIPLDNNKEIFVFDCAAKDSMCGGKKGPNVSQSSKYNDNTDVKTLKPFLTLHPSCQNQLSREQSNCNSKLQTDDAKAVDIEKLRIQEEEEMIKNITLIQNYKSKNTTEFGTSKPIVTLSKLNDRTNQLSYEKRYIDSMFQTDSVKLVNTEKLKIQEEKQPKTFEGLNGEENFVELDGSSKSMRSRTLSKNIANSSRRELVDGSSQFVLARRDSYIKAKAIAQDRLFPNSTIDSDPETLNRNQLDKMYNQCSCLQCHWERRSRERRQKRNAAKKSQQVASIFENRLSNWQKCKITKRLLKAELKDVSDSKETDGSIFEVQPPPVKKILKVSKNSPKTNEIAKKRKRKNISLMRCFGK